LFVFLAIGLLASFSWLYAESFDASWVKLLGLSSVSILAVASAAGPIQALRHERQAFVGGVQDPVQYWYLLSLGLIGLMGLLLFSYIAVLIVSKDVLPNVPEQFGGTKPRTVQLVLTREAQDSLVGDEVAKGMTGSTTQDITLLYEGNDFFLIESHGQRTRIDKDGVQAVLIHND
jgi:hypothetical protein